MTFVLIASYIISFFFLLSLYGGLSSSTVRRQMIAEWMGHGWKKHTQAYIHVPMTERHGEKIESIHAPLFPLWPHTRLYVLFASSLTRYKIVCL